MHTYTHLFHSQLRTQVRFDLFPPSSPRPPTFTPTATAVFHPHPPTALLLSPNGHVSRHWARGIRSTVNPRFAPHVYDRRPFDNPAIKDEGLTFPPHFQFSIPPPRSLQILCPFDLGFSSPLLLLLHSFLTPLSCTFFTPQTRARTRVSQNNPKPPSNDDNFPPTRLC